MLLTDDVLWRGDQRVRWSRPGSGPPVVFCRGTPWSAALRRRIADALSWHFTVYLWNMLGYGTSTMSAGQDVSLATQGALSSMCLTIGSWPTLTLVAHNYGPATRAATPRCPLPHPLVLVDVVAVAPWGPDFFRLVANNSAVSRRSLPATRSLQLSAGPRGYGRGQLGVTAHPQTQGPTPSPAVSGPLTLASSTQPRVQVLA
jgi:pimeloyl-ACP methyl ester carboxylesterase